MAATRSFDAAIGIGSNVGDKRANIQRAITMLTAEGDIGLVRRSHDYRSAPWGVEDQDWFVNACIAVATKLSPRALLERCQHVENTMGRLRTRKWGPRIIDLDVLTYNDKVIDEPDLIVPHPLIGERAFVLLPLREIAPDLRVRGRTIDEMIDHLGVGECVRIDERL